MAGKNAIEVHSAHNERKWAVAERFIRTLKNKIYKYMTSVSSNTYINKLDEIINKYNNSYHGTIKIRPWCKAKHIFIDFNKENNTESSRFNILDHVNISKYKHFLQKAMF